MLRYSTSSGTSRRLIGAGLACAALTAVAACGSGGTPAAASTATTKVTYVTAFGSAGRDSYAWVAMAKGYFSQAGLDVTIQPGAAGEANLKALYSGAAQFAIVDFATAAKVVATGEHPDLRILAAIQQRTVSSIITLDRYHISSPADLVGKKIGTVPGSVLQPMFTGYARLAGIDPNAVHWVDAASPAALPTMLLAHQVDAVAQYSLSVPSIERAAGCSGCAVVLPYDKYVGDPYGAVLVSTGAMIGQHRDEVSRFTGALMRGLQAAIDDPAQAGQILHQYVPTADPASAAAEVQLMAGYVTATTSGQPIGSLDQPRVARAIASLQAVGLYTNTLAPEALVAFDLAPHL